MNSKTRDISILQVMALPFTLLTAVVAGLLVLSLNIGTATATQLDNKDAKLDIVDTAIAAGGFNTLVTAIEAAGLVETLKGEGPFTVLAPADQAFAKIPEETLNRLLADKEALTNLLTYHVIAGRVMAADVAKLDKAKTIQGQEVSIMASDTGVKVGGASVVHTDILTSNGVIHVVDTVLMPN